MMKKLFIVLFAVMAMVGFAETVVTNSYTDYTKTCEPYYVTNAVHETYAGTVTYKIVTNCVIQTWNGSAFVEVANTNVVPVAGTITNKTYDVTVFWRDKYTDKVYTNITIRSK